MNSGTGTTGGAQDARSEEGKRKAEETKQKAVAEAKQGGQAVAEEAKAVGQKAGELGREHAERRFEQGKGQIEGQVDAVSGALGDAAERLRAENNPLASYADELSGQLSQLSRGIENSTLDDVAVKTRQVARDNPGLFVLGSMVAGLAAARFFKASAEREHRERYGSDDGYGYDDPYASRGFQGGDPYRDEGYRSAAPRGGEAYRSPVSGAAVPPRPATTTGVGETPPSPATGGATAGTGALGAASSTSASETAAPSVSRVPMDSESKSTTGTSTTGTSTTGTSTPKTKSGA